jgi:hypothetical protein
MTTPMPRIELAIEGRVDWARRTNPFGGGGKPGAVKAPKSSAEIATDLRAHLRNLKKSRENKGS